MYAYIKCKYIQPHMYVCNTICLPVCPHGYDKKTFKMPTYVGKFITIKETYSKHCLLQTVAV